MSSDILVGIWCVYHIVGMFIFAIGRILDHKAGAYTQRPTGGWGAWNDWCVEVIMTATLWPFFLACRRVES